jgi:Ca-activated chloride channel family protein
MTDVSIDWNGARVVDVFPARLPDLFAGRPIALSARFEGKAPSAVRVRGRVGGRQVEIDVPITSSTTEDATIALPALWARRKIQSLSDFAEIEGRRRADGEVRDLALAHGLMSQFTSFVAVDASGRTAGDHGFSVPVPVPVPAGVRYETTVSDK